MKASAAVSANPGAAITSGRYGREAAYAVAMKDPLTLRAAGPWENWKDPASSEWARTICIITTAGNSRLCPRF